MTGRGDPIRVLVADDHPLYRDGLVRLIDEQRDMEVVGQAEDGDAALAEIGRLNPEIAVLDLLLPGLDAIAVMDRFDDPERAPLVVVVSASLESGAVYRAIEAGAQGYVPKSAAGAEIVAAVRAVARGEVAIAPVLQAGLAGEMRQRRGATERPRLSDRELEVLRLAAEGKTVNTIAEHLYVSAATVKTHLHHAYEKLGVSDRAAAVAQAMREGLLS